MLFVGVGLKQVARPALASLAVVRERTASSFPASAVVGWTPPDDP